MAKKKTGNSSDMSDINGSIRLEDDGSTIIIEELQIQDENIYNFLKEVEEDKRIDILINATRIGVIGLKRMTLGEELDYVEKGFNSLMVKFDECFNPNLKDSHLGKLSAKMEEYFEEGGTVETLFDSTDETTSLGKLKKDLLSEFKDLRDIIKGEKIKEELREGTTLKGFDFEDLCEEHLGEFVSKHMGDELERTSLEIGEITGGKTGDFVITLRDLPDKKIVIETKDKGTITKPAIIENLKSAMENRGAAYGIFVSRYKDALPNKIGWFNEYRGNMLVCALGSSGAKEFFPEVLNIAYQWAKMRVKNEVTIEEKALEILTEAIREIESRLDTFTQIKRQCTNVENASKEIRDLSEKLKEDIEDQIIKIQKAIAAVSEE